MPAASRKKGLGSGRADHNLFFLAIKDLLGLEWDFNYQLGWIGKEGGKALMIPIYGPYLCPVLFLARWGYRARSTGARA